MPKMNILEKSECHAFESKSPQQGQKINIISTMALRQCLKRKNYTKIRMLNIVLKRKVLIRDKNAKQHFPLW